jgi:predicted membrane-bound dolichyl-phosphate-mannose-protein mannosyltransferase
VTLFARLLALAGLALLFMGMPIAAYIGVGHWLAPVIVFVLAGWCFSVVTRDWEP